MAIVEGGSGAAVEHRLGGRSSKEEGKAAKSASSGEPLFNSSRLRLSLILDVRFEPPPILFAALQALLGDDLCPPPSPSMEHPHLHVSPPCDPLGDPLHASAQPKHAPLLFRHPSPPVRPQPPVRAGQGRLA